MSKDAAVTKKLLIAQISLLTHLKDIFMTFKMSATKKIYHNYFRSYCTLFDGKREKRTFSSVDCTLISSDLIVI